VFADEIKSHYKRHHLSMWAHFLLEFGFQNEINSFDKDSLMRLALMLPPHAMQKIAEEVGIVE